MNYSFLRQETEITPQFNQSINLLIMTDHDRDVKNIVSIITEAKLLDNYEVISTQQTDLALIINKYDAIIFNYYPLKNEVKLSKENLPWLFNLTPFIPIILITEALGDEIAIECVKAGISGYLLREKMNLLPQIMQKSLTEFQEKQSQQKKNLELFSNLTHELRTPLTGILGFAKMLNQQIYGQLNPKQLQYVQGIIQSGQHLLGLINDILDLSKIDAAKEELLIELSAVEDICWDSFAIIEQLAWKKNLEFILEIHPNITQVNCDQRRLKQILINLLSNAIKFTETGTITLKVTPENKQVAFSVIDTGIGIKPEDQTQLFQPFGQLETHLHQEYKGTGLGLVLSRKLAQLHGGDITFTSEVGKGSCFTLFLPL